LDKNSNIFISSIIILLIKGITLFCSEHLSYLRDGLFVFILSFERGGENVGIKSKEELGEVELYQL